MIDLMIKMTLCLIVALVLGFIMGWLLSKISFKRKSGEELNKIEKSLIKSEDTVKKLKEINSLQKIVVNEKLEKNFRELSESEKSLNMSKQSLVHRNRELECYLREKDNEIKDLEQVLIKAEDVIADRSSRILLLEKEKDISNQDENILITKDQFSHIEAQLLVYQNEIIQLKKMNKNIKTKSRKELLKQDNLAKEEVLELDNSAIVKLFGDTYKKIIKS